MVDTSRIASIVVTNGNTGEKKILSGDDVNSEEYYFFNDLQKLYNQLDFTAQTIENERVGYQYSMVLQDADGNELQRVTHYKDGDIEISNQTENELATGEWHDIQKLGKWCTENCHPVNIVS